MGNHELYYVDLLYINSQNNKVNEELQHHKWVSDKLGKEYKNYIKKLPFLIEDVIDDIKIDFMHFPFYKQRKNSFNFKKIDEKLHCDNLDSYFRPGDSLIVFFGHDHNYLDCYGTITSARYINPGSLGCQTDDKTRYSILEINNKKYKIRHKKIKYKKYKAIKELDKRKVPDRDFIKKVFYGVD